VGWIIGSVVGILLALVLIAALFAYLYKKRRKESKAFNSNGRNGIRAEETAM